MYSESTIFVKRRSYFLKSVLLFLFLKLTLFQANTQTPDFTWVNPVHSFKDEYSNDVAIDPLNGDVVVVGHWEENLSAFFGSSGYAPTDFSTTYGNFDGFVAKYNPAGNIIWAFKIGGGSGDYINAVDIDTSGNIYLTGTVGAGSVPKFSGTLPSIPDNTILNTGGTDSFVAKYSSAGVLLWYKFNSAATTSDFESFDVSVDNSSVYITGSGLGSSQFDELPFNCNMGGKDFFVARFDLSGNIQWVAIGGSISDDFGYSLIADNNNVYVTGDYLGATFNVYDKSGTINGTLSNTTANKEDIFLLSYDLGGFFNWAQNIGSDQNDHVKELAQDTGNIYMTGGICFGTYFPGYSGNPVLATFKTDVFISSFSKLTGNTNWVNSIPDNNDNDALGNDIVVSSTGKVYFTGYFKEDITFPGTTFLLNSDGDDIFVACYSTSGTYIWAKKVGAIDQDFGNGIAVDPLENIYVSGFYNGLATFDMITVPDDSSSANIFLAKIETPCTNAVGGTASSTDTEICVTQSATITLIGYSGQIIWQSSPPGLDTWTDISGETMASIIVSPIINTDYRAFLTSGTCYPDSSNIVSINVYVVPVANAGSGGDECDLDFQLQSTPSIGTGTWTMTSGTGTISFSSDENDPTAIVTVSEYGTKEFTWMEVNGTCTDAATITVNFYQQPVADAGSGGDECDLDFQLQATPSVGTGTWTMTSGTGTISFSSDENDPTAIVTVSEYGTKEFTWTEVNGTCTDAATITVNFYQQPVADAGSGGDECDLDFQLQATPSVGTGDWSLLTGSGSATFSPSANAPDAIVEVDQHGSYQFAWTEANGICSDDSTVMVTFYKQPVADAGTGGEECDLDFQLLAKPRVGTGIWSKLSGPGNAVFSPSVNDPDAIVEVDVYGNYQFLWTEVNGNCSDDSIIAVTFYEKPVANATANDKVCGLSTTLYATLSTGIGVWKKSSGPGNALFGSTTDISVRQVTVDEYGTYEFTWIETNAICSDSVKITITFYNSFVVNPGVGGEVCGLSFNLQAIPGQDEGYWSSNVTNSSVIFYPSAGDPDAKVTVNEYGTYDFAWTETNGGCTGSAGITVIFQEQPAAYAGPDQILNYQFETSLDADLPLAGAGIWITAVEAIRINDKYDPKSSVTGLSLGDNIITWQVSNGVCIDAKDELVILVNDMVTPTVITPNEDGFNDELIFPGLNAFEGSSIIIYNRWGSEVYRSDDYKNAWRGKDQKNRDLQQDTYYYILNISNGRLVKGFIEIKR